jgi:uncharacterized protein (DUF1697 family)
MGILLNNRFLALLRGINVGGNNIIKMIDLQQCFVNLGFTEVTTYIQSGNVIFSSAENDPSVLTSKIEKALSLSFGYQSKVVLVSQESLIKVIELAPEGFGKENEKYKYDVVFFKEPVTAESAIDDIKSRKDVDIVVAANDVIYFSRLKSRPGQSYLSKIILLPIYKFMTIRNLNTTLKLYELINK